MFKKKVNKDQIINSLEGIIDEVIVTLPNSGKEVCLADLIKAEDSRIMNAKKKNKKNKDDYEKDEKENEEDDDDEMENEEDDDEKENEDDDDDEKENEDDDDDDDMPNKKKNMGKKNMGMKRKNKRKNSSEDLIRNMIRQEIKKAESDDGFFGMLDNQPNKKTKIKNSANRPADNTRQDKLEKGKENY